MKKLTFFLAAFCILVTSAKADAQTTGDYRSAASGSWNSTATWQTFNGVAWVAAVATPTNLNGVITVRSSHTVTVTASVTVDDATINAGGQITLNSGITLTVANGLGTDLSVDGIFRSAGTVTISAGAAITFNSGGKYQHSFTNAGTIPTAAWDTNSTCEIIGFTTGTNAPGGLGQTFGNFTYDCPAQSAAMNFVGGLTTINGNLTVASTGTSQWRFSNAGSALNILGNYIQTGGTLNLINGNGGTGVLNISGNFSQTGGTITVGGNVSTTGSIVFNKAGTQTFTSGGTVSGNVDFTVSSGTTLDVGTSVVTGRAFTLSSGATLNIGSAAGITLSGATGNVQTSARNFSTGASYTYNGVAAQVTGNALSSANNLTIDNGAGVTLTSSVTVNGTLVLATGNFTTDANILNVANISASAISGGGISSYVIGNLQRSIGIGVYLFPIGNDGYSPLTNDVTAISGLHTFTASAANDFMMGVTDTTKAIERTWALSTTAAPNQIESSLTFQFVTGAPPGGDVPATVNTNTLDALRRNGDGTISLIPASSRAANSVTVNGVNAFSEWTLANAGAAPTAIECISFDAYPDDKGSVFIQWQTGYEVSNLGFNVYREEGLKRACINPSLVAGSALLAGAKTVLTAGDSYVWFDSLNKASDPVQYWLEDVDLNGKRTLHGPVRPISTAKLPPLAESILLARLRSASRATATQQQLSILESQSKTAAKAPAPKPFDSPLQVQWDIVSRHAVKIAVRREGWHRVTQPQLVAAGLDPAANPQRLQLFAEGLELPIVVTGQDKPRLDASDSIEFFATSLDTASTDIHTYYLTVGSNAGRRVRFSQASDGKPTAAQSFPFTVERKERSIYFAALKNGDAENFFGPIVSSDPLTQSLTVRNLATSAVGDASLEIALQGATDDTGSTSDHNVKVMLNGSDIGTINFDGQSHKTTTLRAPSNLLREGDNTLTLTALGGEMDLSLLDFIRLTYSHAYAADDNTLRFSAQGQESIKVAGFTSSRIRVLDVTDLNDVQELKATVEPLASGFAVSVTPQDAGQRTLLALTDSQINQPAYAIANQPSGWNRAGQIGDLIMISHHSFIDAARQLQTQRQRQGLKVALVDIEDLYDEFSYGARSPQAIKDFLARARATWKKAPRYVLLAGDASFDPKNYLGFGDSDFVPTKLLETESLETASDDWFVDFNSDSLPDMAIGRLPSRTAGDAAAMVSKIIGYDISSPAESLLLVADRNDEFNFESADDRLRALVPVNLRVNEIRRGQTDDVTAKNRLIEMINDGQKIVNYTGHGSVEIWRGNLLTSADAAELTNARQLPLFVTMTCLNAYFHDIGTNSLAEALMRSENGGAVAVWSSSSLTEPAEQSRMNQELYRLLLGVGQQLTIGEAAARAKAITSNRDIRRSWILFGDPTTKLK